MKVEDIQLMDKYYRETDDVERIILRKQIRKRKLDYLDYFVEECVFCGKIETIRNSQQIIVYEHNVTWKMQNWRPGNLVFRCLECKKKKHEFGNDYRRLRRESMSCRDDRGFVIDYTKWEILWELIEIAKKKMKKMNRTKDGIYTLSHLDHLADLAYPMSQERATRTIREEDIENFLRDRKRKAFNRWAK